MLATGSFPTTTAGYRALVRFLRSHGDVVAVGVEGTGSWGAGLARHLADRTPDGGRGELHQPPSPPPHGKSDPADAVGRGPGRARR